MRRFWESHAEARTTFDPTKDPDGLDNVCQTGAPRLVNRYYDRGQRRAFRDMLRALPPVRAGQTALDVGCGTGRWSRQLDGMGYSVTGIDLQREVIAENARRYPSIRFLVTPVQEFDAQPFDLITTVTVLQHLPRDEQRRAVETMARLLRPGGHAVILENVSDLHSPTVFANSSAEWIAMFESAGLARQASRGYDFSPGLRSYYALTRSVRLSWLPPSSAGLPEPEAPRFRPFSPRNAVMERGDRAAKVLASCVDSLVDPLLYAMHAPIPPAHLAAIFRRP
jgi:2-polyprenyl-3-methyl-5-hydroxy-6-metoxy-1,4-benzoquinol methylase